MTQRNDIDGVAVVTGASGGMGSATARALVDTGWGELLLAIR